MPWHICACYSQALVGYMHCSCNDNDARDPSHSLPQARFHKTQTRCIHVTHTIDELRGSSSMAISCTCSSVHSRKKLAGLPQPCWWSWTCYMSRFPIRSSLQDDADAVCVPDYRSRAHQIVLRLFFTKSSISSERLECHPGDNSLSLRGRSLKKRPGVDRRRKVMSIIMPCRPGSRLSPSPSDRDPRYSPPQLYPHLGGSGGLRAAAISDPMRQNTPDVVRTASIIDCQNCVTCIAPNNRP